MRLDRFLKTVGIFKSRETAKAACNGGYVLLNGKTAKPSKEVKVGDIITVTTRTNKIVLEITGLPPKNLRKQDRVKYFRVIQQERIKPHEEEGFWDTLQGEEL